MKGGPMHGPMFPVADVSPHRSATGPAFQGACRPPSVSILEFMQFKEHMDMRFNELIEICREGRSSRATNTRNTDVTAGELSQLRQHMHRLEALLATISTKGEGLGVGRWKQEAGSVLQVQARLEALQSQQSAHFEELKRMCSGDYNHNQQLEEKLEDIQRDVSKITGFRCFDGALSDTPNDTPFDTPFDTPELTPGVRKTDRDRQFANVAASSEDVANFLQVVGWSNPQGQEDKEEQACITPMVQHYDPVIRCRAYMRCVSTFLVAMNAVYLGVCLHVSMKLSWQGHERPQWMDSGDIAFLVAFILEIMARIALDKFNFFLGKHSLWNVLDLAATLLFVIEIFMQVGNASFIRTLRVLRAARSLHVLRLSGKLHSLRILMRSLSAVAQPIMGACGLLLFMLYLASLGLPEIVHKYIDLNPEAAAVDGDLHRLYGSIWATLFTLLVAVVGNGDWHQLVQPLSAISVFLVPVFAFITFFSMASVSNLLMAALVSRMTLDSQEEDRVQMRESLAFKLSSSNKLRHLLSTTTDCSNTVLSSENAAKALQGPGLGHLKKMGLELQTALGLLKMLDKGRLGIVNLDEFLCGLGQLQTENLSVPMATLMYESKKLGCQIQAVHHLVENLEDNIQLLKARRS